jgi:hypothetical protein
LTRSLLLERSVALPFGAQRPRICSVPPYVSSAGDEAIELARLAGLELDEWQQFVLRESLGERPDGKWAAPTVGLVVGRQNGKNAILEARELAGLFLLGEKLIIHTAHEQKTASEHFRRVLNRIKGTPQLAGRMLKSIAGKGSEGIELEDGARIFFSTRTGGGGRGLTVDLMVYDEAMHLTEDERSALTPTRAALSMHGNIQTWYTGSAVDRQNPKHDGGPLTQVRDRGLSGADKVAYFEWSAPGDDPAAVSDDVASDPEMWAFANPGLGVRISHEWVEHERTVEMGARGFAVERLSIGDWPDPNAVSQDKIPLEAWSALVDASSRRAGPVCFVFDVSPDGASAAIAVGGHRRDGLEHVEIVEHRPGTAWLEERLVELVERHEPDVIECDGRGPAAEFIGKLANRGVTVGAVDAAEHAQACQSLLGAVEAGSFRHLGTPELAAALRGASVRKLVDAWAWSRSASSADICPLVAFTLARRRAELMRDSVYEGRGALGITLDD